MATKKKIGPTFGATREDSKVIWQEDDEMNGLGEPALLINFYSDSVEIQQKGSSILVNYNTLPELCKLLKDAKRP